MSTFIHGLPASTGQGLHQGLTLSRFQVFHVSECLSRIPLELPHSSYSFYVLCLFAFWSYFLGEFLNFIFQSFYFILYLSNIPFIFWQHSLFSNCCFFHSNLFLFYSCNSFSCLSEGFNSFFVSLLSLFSGVIYLFLWSPYYGGDFSQMSDNINCWLLFNSEALKWQLEPHGRLGFRIGELCFRLSDRKCEWPPNAT